MTEKRKRKIKEMGGRIKRGGKYTTRARERGGEIK